MSARGLDPRAKRHARKYLLFLTALIVSGVVFWIVGFFLFLRTIPREPGEARLDAGGETDAIVVLTGGMQRLEAGLELLRRGRGRILFVSGVGGRADVTELLHHLENATAVPVERIALGRQATSTIGNAHETAQWMAAMGFHSLRLVTASYHMPRSLIEFARAMPDLRIVPHPVVPARFDPRQWWRWRDSGRVLVNEYDKYLLSRIAYAIGPALGERDMARLSQP